MYTWFLKDPDHRVKVSRDDLQAVVALTRDADEISHIVENILDSIIEMGKLSVKNVMRKIQVSNHAHSKSCQKMCYKAIGTVKMEEQLSPQRVLNYVARGHSEIIVRNKSKTFIGYVLLVECSALDVPRRSNVFRGDEFRVHALEMKISENLSVSEVLREFRRTRSTRAFVLKKKNNYNEKDVMIGLVSFDDVLKCLFQPHDFFVYR